MARKRKQYTGEEKLAILRKHLLEAVAVSDICDAHELQPTVFYRWQKRLCEEGNEDNPKFAFSVNWSMPDELKYDPEPYASRLRALGCVPGFGGFELDLHRKDHHSAETFEELYLVVRDLVRVLERSLSVS